MDYIQLILSPKSNSIIGEDSIEVLWDYLGCLYKNGQVLRNYELIRCKNDFHAFLTLPEKNSLDKNYNSKYVNDYLEKVTSQFEIKTEYIGENINFDKSCSCNSSSWYMLYTDWTLVESPIVCGDCGKEVPLYKLPYITNKDEHFDFVNWQSAYKNVDQLWMYCLSDRFTFRQLHSPDSQLSKIGRELCSDLEQVIKKPVYYYLYNYRHSKSICPVCGKDWKLPPDEKSFIDYKCETCRLVADEYPVKKG